MTERQRTRPDAPETPLAALLAKLPDHLPIPTIDEVWIFPTHRHARAESTVLLISAFDGDGHRRRILTARFTRRPDPAGHPTLHHELIEHGLAPADRIGRLVDGVLRRLADDLPPDPPLALHIAGNPARWADALARLDPATDTPDRPGDRVAGAPDSCYQ